jgi:hypothetical protein
MIVEQENVALASKPEEDEHVEIDVGNIFT